MLDISVQIAAGPLSNVICIFAEMNMVWTLTGYQNLTKVRVNSYCTEGCVGYFFNRFVVYPHVRDNICNLERKGMVSAELIAIASDRVYIRVVHAMRERVEGGYQMVYTPMLYR